MGVQNRHQRIDFVEQPVQVALLVALDTGIGVPRYVFPDLFDGFIHGFALISKIPIQSSANNERHRYGGYCYIKSRIFQTPANHEYRSYGKYRHR